MSLRGSPGQLVIWKAKEVESSWQLDKGMKHQSKGMEMHECFVDETQRGSYLRAVMHLPPVSRAGCVKTKLGSNMTFQLSFNFGILDPLHERARQEWLGIEQNCSEDGYLSKVPSPRGQQWHHMLSPLAMLPR